MSNYGSYNRGSFGGAAGTGGAFGYGQGYGAAPGVGQFGQGAGQYGGAFGAYGTGATGYGTAPGVGQYGQAAATPYASYGGAAAQGYPTPFGNGASSGYNSGASSGYAGSASSQQGGYRSANSGTGSGGGGGGISADRQQRSVFVGNIPYKATEPELIQIFSQAGSVVAFRLVNDRDTGRPKGFGFCEYADATGATTALEMLNGTELHGRPLRVGSSK